MSATSIQLDNDLVENLRYKAAARAVSLRAYVEAVLERELANPGEDEEDRATRRKFEELGYIDSGRDI